MSNSKISALTGATTPLAGTEVLPIVQSSTTKQISVANLTAGRSVSMATGSGVTGNVASPVTFEISNSSASTSAGTQLKMLYGATLVGYVYNRFNGADFETQIQGNDSVLVKTGSGGNNVAKFTSAGNMEVSTAAKGINFNANTPASGMTSQLLNWYEEGSYTPSVSAAIGSIISYTSSATYTRIGRQITVLFTVTVTNNGTGAGSLIVSLPFTNGSQPSIGVGRENAVVGNILQVFVSASSTTASVFTAVNAYPSATGYSTICTVTYFV